MVYFINSKDEVIIPNENELSEDELKKWYRTERTLSVTYLSLISNNLSKLEFEIFLFSIGLIIHENPGFVLYYGYDYSYDWTKKQSSYYSIDDIYNILADKKRYNIKDIKRTFKKLIKMNIVIPKKSYITQENLIDTVLFVNNLVLTYENSGMGVGGISDLKYDENNIVLLDSYCDTSPCYIPIDSKTISASQKERNSKEAREWTKQIKELANYTCQCCGSKIEKGMAAHHILNWSSHKDLRYDLANGVCLCDKCHNSYMTGSFHNTYGTRNNTSEQLLEYVKNKRNELGIIDTSFITTPFLLEHIEDIK